MKNSQAEFLKRIHKSIDILFHDGYIPQGIIVRCNDGKLAIAWGTEEDWICEKLEKELLIILEHGLKTDYTETL